MDPPPLIVYVSDGSTGAPLEAAGLWVDGSLLRRSDREGYIAVEGVRRGGHRLRVAREGYIAEKRSLSVRRRIRPLWIALQPLADGVLHHRVILLDPSPGSDRSLSVALYLQEYLKAAGAKVHVTRDKDAEMAELERVQLANALQPEIMVFIAPHSGRGRAKIGYYPGSAEGLTLARGIQHALATSRHWRSRRIYEDMGYILQQSPCPTVRVQLSSPRPSKREGVSDGRVEAQALYRGILRYFEQNRIP
jgi:N-acetylmuramoyl-L-alanine amidase